MCIVASLCALLIPRSLYVSIGLLSALNLSFHISDPIAVTERTALYSGITQKEECYGSYNRLQLGIDRVEIGATILSCHIPVTVYTQARHIDLGTRLFIQGYLRNLSSSIRPYVLTGNVVRREHSHSFIWNIIHRIKAHIDRTLFELIHGEHRDVALGLVMGGSGHLDPSLKEVFTRAGIIHVLAVSGLHVGFVCIFGYAILSIFFLPRSIKYIIVMVLVLLYVMITSFRPSVCRAAFMASLFGLAMILERNVDAVHITNMALITLLVIDPMILFSISAQLSFAAVYGIVFLYPKLQRCIIDKVHSKILKRICTPLAVSCSAQVFVAPFLLHYFNRISLIAPLSNLVIVPITSIIVFLLYSSIIVNVFWSGGATILASAADFLISCMLFIGRAGARLPFSTMQFSIPLSLLLCMWGLFLRRFRKYMFFVMGIVLLIASCATLSPRLMIRVFPESVVMSFPDRKNLVIAPGKIAPYDLRVLFGDHCASVDYAITATPDYKISDHWTPFPEMYSALDVQYGDINIQLSSDLTVAYGSQEFRVNEILDRMQNTQEVYYIVSNRNWKLCFSSPIRRSIVDELWTEIRVLFAQCILCVG